MPTQRIAHRGGGGLRVENTLAAFAHAIDLGADGAELDVHLTRDRRVIVHHDEKLNGAYCRDEHGHWLTPVQERAIADLTWEELQRYEIGTPNPASDYARRFDRIEPVAAQHIPLLTDVIRLAQERSQRFALVVEIKTPMLDADRKPWLPLVAAVLADIVRMRFADRTVLCSFDWGALVHARNALPGVKTWFTSCPLGWLSSGPPPAVTDPPDAQALRALRARYGRADAPWFAGFDPRQFAGGYPQAVAAAGGTAWFPYHLDCTRETNHALAHLGLHSAAWSSNLRDRLELARLVQIGTDYLVMDYPDVDLAALSEPR